MADSLSVFKFSIVTAVMISSLSWAGLGWLHPAPVQAQAVDVDPANTDPANTDQNNTDQENTVEDELLQEVLQLEADIIATILEAPFSELFTVTMADGLTGYGVKDQDFDPAYDGIGFYSLWGDVPDQELFQVAVFYCFRNPTLADTELEQVVLVDGDETLVTLDQKLIATQAQMIQVLPARYETTPFFDPFRDSTWGSIYSGGGIDFGSVYLPAVDCSVGGGRFDLSPIKDEIAQLPSKTLEVRLLFSNGMMETWHLGESTVEQIKTLPTLQVEFSP